MTLLARARAAGFAAWTERGRLALEGPEYEEALALELLASEAEVLRALEAERERREAEAPFALLPAGADPDRPPTGWTFVRRGAMSGLWLGPDGALATSSGGAA